VAKEDLERFAERLADKHLTVISLAVAILWFQDHYQPGADRTAAELAVDLESLRLTGNVNRSRLRKNLAAHAATVKGARAGSFAVKRQAQAALDKAYLPLLSAPRVRISDDVIPAESVTGTRKYIEQLVEETNGCFTHAFYDGCAVILRRLVEGLLIECVETANHGAAIKNADGEYMMLRDMVGVVKSGKFIKLSRTAPAALDKVKTVGDRAAHDRYHITRRQDVTDIAPEVRALVSELVAKAGLKKS